MVRKDVSSIVKTRPWASTSRDSCHQNIDLAAWQKQYEYYRDALLSFQRRPSNSQLVAIFLEYGHNSFFAQNDYMIDYLEEEDGNLNAYEFKWNPAKSKTKCPASFAAAYPSSTYKVITPDNIEEFI